MPIVKKFYLYLILIAFVPNFSEYSYFFALDVMKMSKMEIGICLGSAGIFLIFGPIIFQRYCRHTQFPKLFIYSQIF